MGDGIRGGNAACRELAAMALSEQAFWLHLPAAIGRLPRKYGKPQDTTVFTLDHRVTGAGSDWPIGVFKSTTFVVLDVISRRVPRFPSPSIQAGSFE